ncbi:hypothetical protein J2S78_001400 [Salibacterium salarium]|uniref:DUF5325 family protein n=1 Tax=Salibacterium salarium TaxID=284579 RepID=UPI00277F6011|nr:DUF5325 family protein [Salibacterium salarium]MDQ0298980.1 hypothetical protein [Salibacterium salarium]
MNPLKLTYLILAVIATLSIASIGIAVAERSILIAVFCFIGLAGSFTLARLLRAKIDY